MAEQPLGLTTYYCYDADQVISEYDGSDMLLRKFIYGCGPFKIVLPKAFQNFAFYTLTFNFPDANPEGFATGS